MITDLAGGLHRRVARDRIRARPALVQGQSERVDIRCLRRAGPGGLLRRHVGERADDLTRRREGRRADERRDPKVHELRPATGPVVDADDDVLRLHVAVDDPPLMGVRERLAHIGAELRHLAVG